jgi:hypothetical protein
MKTGDEISVGRLCRMLPHRVDGVDSGIFGLLLEHVDPRSQKA